MNRTIFFNTVRRTLFGGALTQEQVGGMTDMLDVWDRGRFSDLRHLGYIFGGTYHECGKRMVPVREGFAKTDAGARQAVANLFRAGKISRNYALPNKAGVSFYGRGRIQNTFEANYKKLEKRFGHAFTTKPDLLLNSKIDAEVTVYGHIEGIWTGKKLADYFNAQKTDWVGARKIVNGTDKAATIAGYAKAFYTALQAAQTGDTAVGEPVGWGTDEPDGATRLEGSPKAAQKPPVGATPAQTGIAAVLAVLIGVVAWFWDRFVAVLDWLWPFN